MQNNRFFRAAHSIFMAGSLFIIYLLFVFIKNPNILINPRMWAEEAVVYYQAAMTHTFFSALFMEHIGYFSFVANTATVLAATLVDIEYAAHITTLISLLVQCIPVVIVVCLSHQYFNTTLHKLCFILIYSIGTHFDEIHLNSINSQHILIGACILIAIDSYDKISRVKLVFYGFVMLLASLSGPGSLFLLPSFSYRLYKEYKRNMYFFYVYMFFLVGVLVQVVYKLKSQNAYVNREFTSFINSLSILTSKNIFFIISADLSRFIADKLQFYMDMLLNNNYLYIMYVLLCIALLFFFFWLISINVNSETKKVLIGALFIYSFFSINFAVGKGSQKFDFMYQIPGSRYFFVSTLIVYLLLYINIYLFLKKKTKTKTIHQKASVIFSLFIIIISLFLGFLGKFNTMFPGTCPSWREEALEWKRNPAYEMRIWPCGIIIDGAEQWKFKPKKKLRDDLFGSWDGSVRSVVNATEITIAATLYINVFTERSISGSFILARPGSPAIYFSGVIGLQRWGGESNGYYNDMLLQTIDGKTLTAKYWNRVKAIEIYAYGTTETGENSADFYIFRQ